MRLWWNWYTRYLEKVVPKGLGVQISLDAPRIGRNGFIQEKDTNHD